MKICFINPPFKAEYGKFSRESRSPSIGHSGVLYYPLWLIYAAALCEKEGFEVSFIDAPAKRLNVDGTMERVDSEAQDAKLFVLDTSTPSIYSDISFGGLLKDRYISWYDFACEIFKQAGYDNKVVPVTTAEYGLSKAKRPFNSRLDKAKLTENGFEPLPTWQDALQRYLQEIQ